jgi:hypothetical protein
LEESGQGGEAGKKVFQFIADQGVHGATCFEVEQALGMLHQTASGRIKVLRSSLALIYHNAVTRVNPATGRNCEVYRIVTDLSLAQSIDCRCGREGNAVQVEIQVIGLDPDNPESTKPVIQEEFTCYGWRNGQSYNLDIPQSLTIYEGDELRITAIPIKSIPE